MENVFQTSKPSFTSSIEQLTFRTSLFSIFGWMKLTSSRTSLERPSALSFIKTTNVHLYFLTATPEELFKNTGSSIHFLWNSLQVQIITAGMTTTRPFWKMKVEQRRDLFIMFLQIWCLHGVEQVVYSCWHQKSYS